MGVFAALVGYFVSDAQSESANIPEKDGGVSAPGAASPLDPSLAPEVNPETGVPEMLAPPFDPQEAMAALGMPVGPDPASAGGESAGDNVTGNPLAAAQDEQAAAAAAKRAKDKAADEDNTINAARTLPKIRGFTDQTFVLMHAMNLINLRNEQEELELEGIEDTRGQDHDVITNTVRSLKHELPFAYHPTDSNPKEQNAVIQCYGEPATFKNYITANPGYQNYIDAPTDVLSSLVPKIKIYKLFGKPERDNGQGEQAVEYVFETSGMGTSDLEDMMASRGAKRGYGVGIKSFDFSLIEGNPLIAHSVVQGTLVIYAGSMEDLLRPRSGNTAASKHLKYRFIELAFAATGERILNSEVINPEIGTLDDLNFQLVFDVGVVANGNVLGLESEYSSTSMKMGPVGHNFDIGQDGTITLTIELEGRIENRFRNKITFDVFATPESLTSDLYAKFATSVVKNSCDAKVASQFKKQQLSIGNSKYKERITLLNDLMRNKGKIYYVNIPPKTMEAYNDAFNTFERTTNPEKSPTSDEDAIIDPMAMSRIMAGFDALKNALSPYKDEDEPDNSPPALDGARAVGTDIVVSVDEKHSKEIENDMEDKPKEEQTAIRDCAIDPNSTQVAYFYVGDLINVILENLSDIYSEGKINAIIGDAVAAASALGGNGADNNEIARVASDLKTRAEDFKKYRIVLGPVLISDFFSKQKIMCCIGDIPVALNHFNAWLAGATEGKNRTRYSLFDFLNQFLTEYLRSFLMGDTKYFDQKSLGKLFLCTSDTIMGYGTNDPEHDTDPLTLFRTSYGGRKGLLYESVPQIDRPLIRNKTSTFLRKNKINSYDYHIFYNAQSEYCLPTTPARMAKSGINVYQQGRDRGIVKEINFQKHDSDAFRTIRVLNNEEGAGNEAASQLTEMFDSTVTTYPDLQTKIGQKVYLAPQSITPYLSKETLETFPNFKGLYNLDRLGLGGFYEVNQIFHSFGVGKMETRLICIQDGRWMQDRRDEAKIKEQEQSTNETQVEEVVPEPTREETFRVGGIDTFDNATGATSSGDSEITQPPKSGVDVCKDAFGGGPEGPTSPSRGLAEGYFSQLAETAMSDPESFIAHAKGLLDNSSGKVRDAIASVLGIGEENKDTTSAADGPTEGSQKAANNGPVTPVN